MQQSAAFAGGAAALAARSGVGAQALSRGQIVVPGDVAGVVVGQAHAPLVDRQQLGPGAELAVGVDGLALAGATVDERAGVDRIGEQVVDSGEARRLPAHALLADGPSWQQLLLGVEL